MKQLSLAVIIISFFNLSAQIKFEHPDHLAWKQPGDLIELSRKKVILEKVLPLDSRWVKGHVINPIDGKVDSYNFNGNRFFECKYPTQDGHNTVYSYQKDPGLHITLADKIGFDYIILRGGFMGKMYRNVDKDDGTSGGRKIITIKSPPLIPLSVKNGWYAGQIFAAFRSFRKQFDQPIKTNRVSFFWNKRDWTVGGTNTNIADISFYRKDKNATRKSYIKKIKLAPKGSIKIPNEFKETFEEPYSLKGRKTRFIENAPQTFIELAKGKAKQISMVKNQYHHFMSPILPVNSAIGALKLKLDLIEIPKNAKLMIIVQDPFNRRAELMRASFNVIKPGMQDITMDFPDQMITASEYRSIRLMGTGSTPLGPFLLPPLANSEENKVANLYLDAVKQRTQLKDMKDIDRKRVLWTKYSNRMGRHAKKLAKMRSKQVFDQTKYPGRRFWVSMISDHPFKLGKKTKFEFLLAKPHVAEKEFKQQRLLLLKGLFAMMSEARPWMRYHMVYTFKQHISSIDQEYRRSMLELLEMLLELKARYPKDSIIDQYYQWFHMGWQPQLNPERIPKMPTIAGIPRWAQLYDLANRKISDIVNWWIDHRRATNGEFGGSTNDDTCLMPWLLTPALINSNLKEKVLASHIGVMENAIQHKLKDGINKRLTDYGHAYEDGLNQLAVMHVSAYGHPRYVEYAMESLKSMQKIAPMTRNGYRRFIPHNTRNGFGHLLLKTEPPQDDGWWKKKPFHHVSAVNFHPILLHAWYNRHPSSLQFLEQYAKGSENFRRCGGYDSGPMFSFGMYWMTENPKYVVRTFYNKKSDRFALEGAGGSFAEYMIHTNAGKNNKIVQDALKVPQYTFKTFIEEAWAITQKRSDLERGLEKALWGDNNRFHMGGVAHYTHIYKEAEMFTDRIFIPHQIISQAGLGGTFARNNFWPSYAISWENLSTGYASLVLEQGKDKLKVAAINLENKTKLGSFRTWQLDHGLYQVTIGIDENDDGVMDKKIKEYQKEIMRMDTLIEMELPAQKIILCEIRRTKKLDPIYKRTDLAVSHFDLLKKGQQWHLTVHNIGQSRSLATHIALFNRSGKEIHRINLPPIDPPLDLSPKTIVVTLPKDKYIKSLIINSDRSLPELTWLNNRLTIPD